MRTWLFAVLGVGALFAVEAVALAQGVPLRPLPAVPEGDEPPPDGAPPAPQPSQPPPPPPTEYRSAPPPPVIYAVAAAQPKVHAPMFSLWAGGRLGLMGFNGFFYDNEQGQGETTGNFVTSGVSFEADVGARLGKRYVPYLFLEHTLVGAGHRFDGEQASAGVDFYGIGFRYTAGDVNTAGFVTDLAAGIRSISVSSGGNTYKMQGLEIFRLGLGAEIRLSTLFTISPLAWVSGGAMSDTSGHITYGPQGSGDGLTSPTYQNGQPINSQRGYLAIGIGCGGHFDIFGQ